MIRNGGVSGPKASLVEKIECLVKMAKSSDDLAQANARGAFERLPDTDGFSMAVKQWQTSQTGWQLVADLALFASHVAMAKAFHAQGEISFFRLQHQDAALWYERAHHAQLIAVSILRAEDDSRIVNLRDEGILDLLFYQIELTECAAIIEEDKYNWRYAADLYAQNNELCRTATEWMHARAISDRAHRIASLSLFAMQRKTECLAQEARQQGDDTRYRELLREAGLVSEQLVSVDRTWAQIASRTKQLRTQAKEILAGPAIQEPDRTLLQEFVENQIPLPAYAEIARAREVILKYQTG